MRILFITPGFAAHDKDVNCIPPLQMLVAELRKLGVEIHIIALEYPYSSAPYDWQGAHVWPCNGQNRHWLKWRTFALAVWRVQWLKNRYQFDAIHSFWYGMATKIAQTANKLRPIPHFITFMGQDALPNNPHLPKSIKQVSVESASRWIVLTHFQQASLAAAHLPAQNIVPWGVSSIETPIVLPSERPIDIIGVGAFLPVKDWARWLRLLRKAKETQPNMNAVLIGDGPLRESLEEQAFHLGLAENLQFMGHLPRNEVLKKMQKAKVLLHTAQFESFGMVLPEALQQGCRVVSTPVGIAPEYDQIAVSNNDPELTKLVINALQQSMKQKPVVLFTMEQCAAQYLALYQKG